MSDITGAVVALLALKNSGVLDALKDPSKKKFDWSWKPKEKGPTGEGEVYDPDIDYTVTTISGETFPNKLACRRHFSKLGLPIPDACK